MRRDDMSKPTIVVTNGTAGEGYWSVYYLLKTGQFNVRATARRTDSPLADRLRALGSGDNRVEIVRASNEDEAALRLAFEGAEGIYGTTIYNIHAKKYRADNPEEVAQGHAVIAAAASCQTLRHFVWQTMTKFERVPEQEGLESPIHFRTKWQLEELVQERSLPWTLLRQPAYIRQIKFGLLRKNKLVYPYPPDTRLSYVAEEDIGKCVAQIFLDRERFMHQTVKAVSEVLTPVELAQRINGVNPEFSPRYRKASFLYNAFFDYVVCGFNPAFRYVSQINGNLMAGNPFDMNQQDKEFCAELVSPLKLSTIEDWLREE
jgi:uncharacterized protein YbjT (DUF2867 family)